MAKQQQSKKILVVTTSAGEYATKGYRTGLWLGELTHFYDVVVEAGHEVTIVSIAGGQVPLDPARRGAALHEDAASLLRALQAGEVPDPLQVGDPMDPARTFDGATTEEIATLFGPEFVAALLAQAPGTWAGPIASGYGLHLVLVEEVRDQPPVPFDEVREAVVEDWAAARAQEQRERFYQDIRQRYAVRVERPGMARP